MVSVDADGTIKINGSTDFKIYKNGRPNNSYSRNAKEIFKSLPANMIEKIEVITEPGAREDAEGVSAILNIVTLKNTVTKGAMGNVSLRHSTPQYIPTPNIWFQAQYDKFAISFYGGMNYSNRKASKSNSTTETVYEQTGDTLRSESENRSRNIFAYYGLSLTPKAPAQAVPKCSTAPETGCTITLPGSKAGPPAGTTSTEALTTSEQPALKASPSFCHTASTASPTNLNQKTNIPTMTCSRFHTPE